MSRKRAPTLKEHLDHLVAWYERPAFIDDDPVAACHGYGDSRDQEVIGLYAATLAWGRRATMLAKLEELCERMRHQPYAFARNFDRVRDAQRLEGFKHRTFLTDDALWFTSNLGRLLKKYHTVEAIFADGYQQGTTGLAGAIQGFSERMMRVDAHTPPRLQKHLARPMRGSAAKRLCMFLRWMVRPGPVDLGLWQSFSPRELVLPLDVHSGRQARALGLLTRRTNDWKAAQELTDRCRIFSPTDPARYDFAFFGLGAMGLPPHIASWQSQ